MKKSLILFLLTVFPVLAIAADGDSGALTFAPPASDYSVVFLGNLFGTVDGVLHGSGSQIMGAMFGVFNAAVLAIGGIIIMYTLLVSTMNTAHEGQVLGQKWSSIWIPIRSTAGLALLIPKASGYCLMQIFVMWIVLQGVGAADKIWDAALDYLNRGGVIIRAEVKNPLGDGSDVRTSPISAGAGRILSGQVCMYGLQRALEQQRQKYLQAKQNNSGPCSGSPTGAMKTFCQTAVPDFLSTVNAIAAQNDQQKSGGTNNKNQSFYVDMPNFDDQSPYYFLNGICGTIKWNPFTSDQISDMQKVAGNNQLDTIKLSRAIGVQQMYTDLASVARIMVNNNPRLSQKTGDDDKNNYSSIAEDQFGVPYGEDGSICQSVGNCVTWGAASTADDTNRAVLFNGTEFLGAISDYNGILNPALNLLNEAKKGQTKDDARKFISEAENKGWMLAGSYFFDLVKLNSSAAASSDFDVSKDQPEQGSGLSGSSFNATKLTDAFGSNNTCQGTRAALCTWFNGKSMVLQYLQGSITGPTGSNIPNPTDPSSQIKIVTGTQSATVWGFINNSLTMKTPGQPGIDPGFKFANMIHVNVDTSDYRLPNASFDCGEIKILTFHVCLGRMFGELFYNGIFRPVFNFFLNRLQHFIEQAVLAFLMIPLQGMAYIFQDGLKVLSTPGINPIVALAQMGTTYINFTFNLWIMLLTMSITAAILPFGIGMFILALIIMAMPLLASWLSVMVAIGFVTAYYIPLLPYLIFIFGVIAWLMAVIDAMVAGPVVALGVTYPEGHDAFGKGEPAIMILLNVFLRPSMMIIGYIAAIALSYVGVWILNTGYEHAVSFMQPVSSASDATDFGQYGVTAAGSQTKSAAGIAVATGYTSWAGVYAFFFSILAYTSAYLIIVQKSFGLITSLPDKVLRWIGGPAEGVGAEAAQWGEEAKGKVEKGGEATSAGQGAIDKALKAKGQQAIQGAKDSAKKGLDKLKSGEGNIEATPSAGPE
ncbi:type IVB secretion system protein DotA [Legionella israelensis]|uniref:DotA n=1 Tax=Legionella israelensis TaxID=454 RepID=A0A0W0V2W0_9GAMM|nr:type IVB secretion system protein DotA [Legionella israelensis]KTD14465.1 DotA [Legionella israelensis]QBS09323.1 type IV secretion protein DotA [Legionella israelensis]SCX89823.1 defect in organelle trafficking protein DotA [Legionella israelensis DSM 19235]STX60220.1 DotA [Legionella israelensis]